MHSDENSPGGKLLSKYVTARITSMTRVDIGLFTYDRNNAIYFFAMNADEQIYLRYGGRDETSGDAYLDLNSFGLALQQGLEQHALYAKGELARTERPAPFFPREIPSLKDEVLAAGRCVECHLIGDYQLLEKEMHGTLDKAKDIFISPDIQVLGIHLDVPKGLVVKEALGAVKAAGMKPGDRVSAIEGTPVFTFGDLQHFYDKVPRDTKAISLAVDRDGATLDLAVELPKDWWFTDLYHRYMSVDPQSYFWVESLSAEDKSTLGLKEEGFASRVTRIDSAAQVYNLHKLEVGDVIYSVNGVETDDFTQNVLGYIKLSVEAGDSYIVRFLRDGEAFEMKIRTHRENFRKPNW